MEFSFKKVVNLFVFASLLVFSSCQKDGPGNYSWQKGAEYDILRKCTPGIEDLRITSSGGYYETNLGKDIQGTAICGVQNKTVVIYLLNQNLNPTEYTFVDKIYFEDAHNYPDISVDFGYGEKRTVNYKGICLGTGLRHSNICYFPVFDYYSEPMEEGRAYSIDEIASVSKNFRMIISQPGAISTFDIPAINDNTLFAPGPDGGVIYNGVLYSGLGKVLGKVPASCNTPFFSQDFTNLIKSEDWFVLAPERFLGIRLNSASYDGIGLECDIRYFTLSDGELSWNGKTARIALNDALSEIGTKLSNNERIESISRPSYSNGRYKYEVAVTKYSGDKAIYILTFDPGNYKITAEQK